MNEDFTRPCDGIRMTKVSDVPRVRMVRIYRSGPEDWTFQLRSPIGLGTFGLRDGKDFIVASASMSLEDMRAIRDALSRQIEKAEYRAPSTETLKDKGAWP